MPPFDKKTQPKTFLPCGTVAGNRARRMAAKEQTPKVLIPLLTVAVFVGMLVDRLRYVLTGFGNRRIPLERRQSTPDIRNPVATSKACNPDKSPGSQSIRAVKPGSPASLPLSGSTPEQVTRIVAFMIRNKGRIDNSVSEQKWRELDRHDMPLAIYLRHIEAEGRWHDLESDLKRLTVKSAKTTKSGSKRDRDIIALIPEWSRRGKELLATMDEDVTADHPRPERDPQNEDDPTPPPKP